MRTLYDTASSCDKVSFVDVFSQWFMSRQYKQNERSMTRTEWHHVRSIPLKIGPRRSSSSLFRFYSRKNHDWHLQEPVLAKRKYYHMLTKLFGGFCEKQIRNNKSRCTGGGVCMLIDPLDLAPYGQSSAPHGQPSLRLMVFLGNNRLTRRRNYKLAYSICTTGKTRCFFLIFDSNHVPIID
jgi:hypothetical protein